MTRKQLITIIFATAAFLLLIPVIIFLIRAPVLIIAEQSSVMLYGKDRLGSMTFQSSLSLFRRVKTVEIANDAGDDIVRYAIQDVSKNPYCVIFPYRFVHSAVFYHEQNPEIRVVLLEGRHPQDDIIPFFLQNEQVFIYRTDIEDEFYRAGLAAASLAEENKSIAVFIDSHQYSLFGLQAKEAFFSGLNDFFQFSLSPQVNIYTSVSELSENFDFSSVLMIGAGVDFFEINLKTAVFLFSWLDPLFLPSGIIMIIDDSPWAQVTAAVKMADKKENEPIKSKFTILDRKKFNKELYRKLSN